MERITTIRQQIVELLEESPKSAREISQSVQIQEKEVYDHLHHIRFSLAHQQRKLIIHQAQCLKCGFIFKNRKKYRPPGNCPGCKGTHIQRPLYAIK